MGRSTRSRRLPDSHCAEAAGEAWRCAFSLSLVCHRVAQQTHAGRKCMKWLHGGSKIWCGGDVWCTAFIWQPGGSGAGWLARLGGWVAVDPPAHPPTHLVILSRLWKTTLFLNARTDHSSGPNAWLNVTCKAAAPGA
jgi:hypothetical protein